MMQVENDCAECSLPCTDCGRKHVEHFYCDECGDETMLYEFDGEQLCSKCLVGRFEVVNE